MLLTLNIEINNNKAKAFIDFIKIKETDNSDDFVLTLDVYSNKFKLYPNPSPTGIFILENNLFSENNSHFTANIVNITGQTVKTISVNETDNIIDLSNFKKGIYFIEINANNFKISKQLILY